MRTVAPALCAWVERMNNSREHPASMGGDGRVGPATYSAELCHPAAIEAEAGPGGESGWLPDDQVPDTLLPLLSLMFRDHLPVIRDTDRLLSKWIRDKREELGTSAGEPVHISRAIGMHTFHIGSDVEEKRIVFPYCLWMFQRAHDLYSKLSARRFSNRELRAAPGDPGHGLCSVSVSGGAKAKEWENAKAKVDALLEACGGLEHMRAPMQCRLTRRNNKLVGTEQPRPSL